MENEESGKKPSGKNLHDYVIPVITALVAWLCLEAIEMKVWRGEVTVTRFTDREGQAMGQSLSELSITTANAIDRINESMRELDERMDKYHPDGGAQ